MDFDTDDAGSDDLRATLTAAFAGTDGGSEASEPEHHEGSTDGGEAAAPAKPAVERSRHPDGKFAPKPDAAAPAAPAPGAEANPQPPAAATPPETPAQPAAATRPAPQSWSAESKQGWAALPPAIQEEVLKREGETSRALQESAQARRFTSTVEQIITPHAQLLQREGVDVPTAIGNLLSFHAFFDRDPAGCIAHLQQLAAQRGQRLPPSPQGGAPQPPAAPPRQVPQPVDVQRLVREELASHAQQQSIASEIAAFSAANPHFEAVKPAMAQLIQAAHAAGQPMTMKDAYDRAIWADPAIRPTLLAAQAAAAAPQPAAAQVPSAADQAARVARARQASGSVRGAPSGTTAKPGDRSLREELAANFYGR